MEKDVYSVLGGDSSVSELLVGKFHVQESLLVEGIVEFGSFYQRDG